MFKREGRKNYPHCSGIIAVIILEFVLIFLFFPSILFAILTVGIISLFIFFIYTFLKEKYYFSFNEFYKFIINKLAEARKLLLAIIGLYTIIYLLIISYSIKNYPNPETILALGVSIIISLIAFVSLDYYSSNKSRRDHLRKHYLDTIPVAVVVGSMGGIVSGSILNYCIFPEIEEKMFENNINAWIVLYNTTVDYDEFTENDTIVIIERVSFDFINNDKYRDANKISLKLTFPNETEIISRDKNCEIKENIMRYNYSIIEANHRHVFEFKIKKDLGHKNISLIPNHWPPIQRSLTILEIDHPIQTRIIKLDHH